jgi:hypothetical protein
MLEMGGARSTVEMGRFRGRCWKREEICWKMGANLTAGEGRDRPAMGVGDF